MAGIIDPALALALSDLLVMPSHGIASRVLARTRGGNVTLFAFDAGEGLSEHTSPFDALVLVIEGSLTLDISGLSVFASTGTITRLPAGIPHAVHAETAARMLLIMLRESVPQPSMVEAEAAQEA